MPTPRVGSAHAAVLLLLWSIAMLTPRDAYAQPVLGASSFLPLRDQHRVLFETRDGRWLKAQPIGIFGDSLWLERPVARFTNGRFRLAMADVAHAYVPRKNPRRMALAYGVTGAAGGALLELGLGSRHAGAVSDATHLLVVAGLNGGITAGVGALIGIVWPAWRQAVPPPGDATGAAIEPFPAWSVSAFGGVTDPASNTGTTRRPGIALAAFKNMGPHLAWGYEYGTLSWESLHTHIAARVDTFPSGPYFYPEIDEDFQERWVYSTLQFRVRMLRAGIRPVLTFGIGSYMLGSPFRETVTDATGAVRTYAGRDLSSSFGANAGVGLTWGRGPTRPGVEVRYHALTADQHAHWLTVQAGVIYQ